MLYSPNPTPAQNIRKNVSESWLACPALSPVVTLLVITLLCSGCGGDSSANDAERGDSIEEQLHTTLDQVNTDTDFTLLVEANNGAQFIHRRGSSTENTVYRSASTSKMISAAVILYLVDQGILSLDDHPQDYLDFWPDSGNHADITLRQLLSFTSGLNQEPLCINNPLANFSDCVANILGSNTTIATPGSSFYYASTHLQVAGLMAIEASGMANWTAVFNYFKTQTSLFTKAAYDLPSANNPRLAGGVHWKATEYLAFLSALYRSELLSPALLAAMTSDQLDAATILYSPVAEGPLDYDWHYGFGLWIECDSVPFDCASTNRVSSAGAYGAYPFIDFEQGYFGIVAREGALATGHEGYLVWARVADPLAKWAMDNQ